jgi:hypothetical protein
MGHPRLKTIVENENRFQLFVMTRGGRFLGELKKVAFRT